MNTLIDPLLFSIIFVYNSFTPFLKYIVPWTIIGLLSAGTIAAIINGQLGFALAVGIVATMIVAFMRTMLMDLKKVFLDKENKVIIVKGKSQESIPYTDIKEILRPLSPPYIATVRLRKDYSFGNAFTFIPAGHPFFWEKYDEDLKSKMRT